MSESALESPHGGESAPVARPNRRRAWTVALLSLWAALLVVAFIFDGPFAEWFQAHTPKGAVLRQVVTGAHELTTVPTYVVLGALLLLHRERVRLMVAYLVTIGAYVAGLHLLKFIFGRARPSSAYAADGFTWFGNPREGLNSFPSGHATEAFALAMLAGLYFPQTRWVFFPLALLVGLGRVAQNVHFISDVVAAAGYAIFAVLLAVRLFGPDAFPRFRRRDLVI